MKFIVSFSGQVTIEADTEQEAWDIIADQGVDELVTIDIQQKQTADEGTGVSK